MVSRRAKAVLVVRDAVVTVAALVLIGTSWGKWAEEPVFYILDSMMAVFLVLSAVDVALIVARTKRRGFFVGNSAFQVVPGLLLAGLFAPLGIIIILLNAISLVALRQKKTPEELAMRPPVPITRDYRLADGAGVLVMAGSMFLPWFSAEAGSTASLLGIYYAIVAHTGLPNFSVSQVGVLFALLGLVLSPVAVALGALGMVRRRLSLISGVLGVLAGVGIVVAIAGAAGVGAYGFLGGGAVVLVGFFGFRKA